MMRKIRDIVLFTPHRAIFLYRLSNKIYNKGWTKTAYILKSINITLNGCEISPAAKIGKNLTICHTPGIVIGDGVVIGDNAKLFQNITLGTKDGSSPEYPIVGNNVTLFCGCVIVGNVTIGDNSVIGANSVVLNSVPTNSIAVGIPATCKAKVLVS
ncbi:serine O-acetyltransferase [Peribacillus butanolivorans]|uniref:Serine acetyltransferase n=1 Tax=Peribacillus butanolivorans TaxID=421767 RepID=A0AAX0RXI9_9BACI|nr:serine O-acetyltransferase [Peribacillus butanolivorans]PEJ25961.1 serine O-acetyltransferase [Peribacillus butanolivorans]